MFRRVNDEPKLQRFIEAQASIFETALAELQCGSKQSHWMWFIFPQLAGLGRSSIARHYAITSLAEAQAYLDHPLLGGRLRLCVETMLGWATRRTVAEILGEVDALKFCSCLTLFDHLAPNGPFTDALGRFYAGKRDELTLALLNAQA